MRAQWNTGRLYTENGQRIVASTFQGGLIFNDLDRQVEGFIPYAGQLPDANALKEIVMFNYDRGNYSGSWWAEARRLKWENSDET